MTSDPVRAAAKALLEEMGAAGPLVFEPINARVRRLRAALAAEQAEQAERAEIANRLLAVRSRISLINTDIDRPSAQRDWPDLRWACDELAALSAALSPEAEPILHVCDDDCSATKRSPEMFRRLSQTEYGYTRGGSLANGGLYADEAGRVYFLTDDEAQARQGRSEPTVGGLYVDAGQGVVESAVGAAPVPGPFSCHVHVASVYSNTGGEGSTATLEFEEGGGIDIRPGRPTTDSIPIQVTADTEELVKPGAIIKFTLSAIEETP